MFQKLRKTSISRRFSIGITAVVVLLLVTTAIRVIYPIHIYTTIGSEIREREEKIALISAVGDHIDAIVTSILMLHLVSSEERTHFLDTIKQDADRIEGNFAFLKAIVRTQKGTHLLTELVDLYHDRATGIAFFVDAEKNASTTYVLPIHDIIHLSARYHAQVQQFVEYQQHAEYNIQRLAENTMYLTIFYEIIVNLLVAILLGFVAWWIIPNINKPIRKISQFVETISHGKVPEPMVGEWAGEFEDIRKHINNMSEAINALFTLDHYALQVGTRNPVANLELALQNHLDWKMQFATAVHNKTQIDRGAHGAKRSATSPA